MLSLYSRSKGQASKRVDSHCEPLSEEQRRAITADTIQEVRRPLKTKRAQPGIDPEVTDHDQPLLIALSSLKRRITENTNTEIKRTQFSDGQEIAVSAFPQTAVDEVVTNAIIHRDGRLSRPVVIDQSPQTLKVWSPGSLPVGVTPNRMLTTQSIPRNSRLMSAMRMLGLAEESSRGFDRIWAALLGSGRDIPDVHTEDTFTA
ncbi:AAA family ATPase [Corynebacterium rouxii]|uniref:AAA family ATPase n=1 Tax=Corynebacterium rouxii TaxID=2719119 RepID=A0A6I8M979_9CORY|nr:ATP-binding protein [Corynebacterium rouxii]VZH84087.1 AAA family ATPase [Corynebacterium rouxii]